MRAQEFEDGPRTCQVTPTSSAPLVSIHFLVYALPSYLFLSLLHGLYPWGSPEPPPATSWCVPLPLPVSAPHSPLPLQDPAHLSEHPGGSPHLRGLPDLPPQRWGVVAPFAGSCQERCQKDNQ